MGTHGYTPQSNPGWAGNSDIVFTRPENTGRCSDSPWRRSFHLFLLQLVGHFRGTLFVYLSVGPDATGGERVKEVCEGLIVNSKVRELHFVVDGIAANSEVHTRGKNEKPSAASVKGKKMAKREWRLKT